MSDDISRDTERVDLLGTLLGEVMVFLPMTIRQISKGGMQVETTSPLQVDSLHEFRLTLGELSVVVKGRVAHSHISEFDHDVVTYRSGIEFVEPPRRISEAISDFVEELRQARTPQ